MEAVFIYVIYFYINITKRGGWGNSRWENKDTQSSNLKETNDHNKILRFLNTQLYFRLKGKRKWGRKEWNCKRGIKRYGQKMR